VRIESLHLQHFRNYTQAYVRFGSAQNLILGNNGQGKTNLLEAIYLLSHARSHRSNDDRELILTQRLGQTGKANEESPALIDTDPFALPGVEDNQCWAKVSAVITSDSGLGEGILEARLRVDAAGRLKTAFLWNGIGLKSRSAVLGHLPTVSFFLPDLLLLRGTPEDRRRWLDAAIVQYDRNHLNLLTEFLRIRQQKSRLLKAPLEQLNQSQAQVAHLQIWNLQFAAAGAKLMVSRLRYLALIGEDASQQYSELSDRTEALTLNYQANTWPEMEPCFSTRNGLLVPDPGILEQALNDQLDKRMPDEIRRGTCLVGPHRDDIQFSLDGLSAEAYGSQGQQRGIVLALKLAELSRLSQKLGEPPVLLMDDVMAELDPKRQRLLLEHMQPGNQMFLTTTHSTSSWQERLQRSSLSGEDTPTAVFQVDAGQISELPLNGSSLLAPQLPSLLAT
jgi:DNA replication and repair protein RecF